MVPEYLKLSLQLVSLFQNPQGLGESGVLAGVVFAVVLVTANKQLALRLAAFNVDVSTCGLRKRVDVVNNNTELARRDELKKLAGILLQVPPLGNIAIYYRAHELDIFRSQSENVDRRHGARLPIVLG